MEERPINFERLSKFIVNADADVDLIQKWFNEHTEEYTEVAVRTMGVFAVFGSVTEVKIIKLSAEQPMDLQKLQIALQEMAHTMVLIGYYFAWLKYHGPPKVEEKRI